MRPVIGQRLRDEANVVLMGKKGASKKGQRLAHRDPNGLAHNPTNLSKQYTDSSNKRFSYIVIELICHTICCNFVNNEHTKLKPVCPRIPSPNLFGLYIFIAEISHHRHHRQWRTLFKQPYFLA